MKLTTILLCCLIILACKESKNLQVSDTVIKHDTVFVYRDTLYKYKTLFESYMKEMSEKDLKSFYGIWTITDIAKVGGSFAPESEIVNRLGKSLLLTKSKVIFDFQPWKTVFNQPQFKIKVDTVREFDTGIQGTTHSFGYRPERKLIYFIVVTDQNQSLYFEVINNREIAYYYSGRIYFLTK